MKFLSLLRKILFQMFGRANDAYEKHHDPLVRLRQLKRELELKIRQSKEKRGKLIADRQHYIDEVSEQEKQLSSIKANILSTEDQSKQKILVQKAKTVEIIIKKYQSMTPRIDDALNNLKSREDQYLIDTINIQSTIDQAEIDRTINSEFSTPLDSDSINTMISNIDQHIQEATTSLKRENYVAEGRRQVHEEDKDLRSTSVVDDDETARYIEQVKAEAKS